MILHESSENYLETILIIKNKFGYVRSIDVANELNFSKPSISKAMKLLRENGYITVDENGYIHLTQQGMEIAQAIYEKHILLAKHLVSLGVDEEIALQDACKIEHVISTQSFEKIRQHLKQKGI